MTGYDMTQVEKGLPTKLEFQVIIDAIFEIRFNAHQAVADLLPGTLLQLFGTPPRVERLPLADVPQQIRIQQPELAHQPITRLVWPSHAIFVGERMLGIACTVPYPGWKEFKRIITTLINHLAEINIFEAPNRFSVKYVDFLPTEKFPESMKVLNWSLNVGESSLEGESVSLKSQQKVGDFVVVRDIHSRAEVQVQGCPKQNGILLATDVARIQENNKAWPEFLQSFDVEVDALHDEGKRQFFTCLTKEAIEILKPTYD